jgi:serine/threonine-protein kinase
MKTSVATLPSEAGVLLEARRQLASKCRILGWLGKGSLGAVFAADALALGGKVAIKLIGHELVSRPELVGRFLAEARAATRIASEHVCRVLEVGSLASGAPYVVTEYLEGCHLGYLLSLHGPIPEPLAVDLALQACEALAEAHAAGVVHRDLKPENLSKRARRRRRFVARSVPKLLSAERGYRANADLITGRLSGLW